MIATKIILQYYAYIVSRFLMAFSFGFPSLFSVGKRFGFPVVFFDVKPRKTEWENHVDIVNKFVDSARQQV